MKKKYNKKPLIALFVIGLVVAVGGTMAYFGDAIKINNVFSTHEYGTEIVETFTSPTGWTPGTRTPATFTVTNTGDVDVAVRVKLTGVWTSANDTELFNGIADTDTATSLDLNIGENKLWTTKQTGGWYYYKTKLAPDAVTTSSLINAVTFNAALTENVSCSGIDGEDNTINADANDIFTSANGGATITCTTDQNGYAGATYVLTLEAQTVQYDKYKDAWGLDSNSNLVSESL